MYWQVGRWTCNDKSKTVGDEKWMQDWGAWHCGAPLLSFCWVLAAIILNTTTQLYVVLVGLSVRELCCADPTVQLNDFSNILWFIYLNFKDLYLEKSPLWLATEPLYVPVVGSWMASNCCCMEQKVRKQIKGYLLWLSHALGRVFGQFFISFSDSDIPVRECVCSSCCLGEF